MTYHSINEIGPQNHRQELAFSYRNQSKFDKLLPKLFSIDFELTHQSNEANLFTKDCHYCL